MVYFSPKHLFEFVHSYVEIQRTTPAIRLSDLEALAQKHGISLELYGFGDTVVAKLQDLRTASTAGEGVPPHFIYLAMQFPWQEPISGAELLSFDKIKTSSPIAFRQGSFWIVK